MKNLHKHLISTYMLFTVLMALCLITFPEVATVCFPLGGSSLFYVFYFIIGLLEAFAPAMVTDIWAGWVLLIPVVVLPFYILTKMDKYLPFFIFAVIDTVIVWLFAGMAGIFNAWYLLADVIVSTAFTLLLGGALLYRHKHWDQYI